MEEEKLGKKRRAEQSRGKFVWLTWLISLYSTIHRGVCTVSTLLRSVCVCECDVSRVSISIKKWTFTIRISPLPHIQLQCYSCLTQLYSCAAFLSHSVKLFAPFKKNFASVFFMVRQNPLVEFPTRIYCALLTCKTKSLHEIRSQ